MVDSESLRNGSVPPRPTATSVIVALFFVLAGRLRLEHAASGGIDLDVLRDSSTLWRHRHLVDHGIVVAFQSRALDRPVQLGERRCLGLLVGERRLLGELRLVCPTRGALLITCAGQYQSPRRPLQRRAGG